VFRRYVKLVLLYAQKHNLMDCKLDELPANLPFEVEATNNDADLTLRLNSEMDKEALCVGDVLSTSYVAEADADSSFARSATGYLYSIKRRVKGATETLFHIDRATGCVETNIDTRDIIDVSILRFGIWVMFGVVLCVNDAIAIHSSAIVVSNRCALFLGESGTGKSTHTRLWIKHIDGAKLLNDDSPIVRVVNNEVMVYGSPWSGKTPCYKSESYPLAGLCRLEQAPYNKIEALATIPAIGALLPSCPPIFAHDEVLQDRICTTVGRILRKVRAYRLACLPDEAAAQMSYKTIVAND
jgi:hypothetical protein